MANPFDSFGAAPMPAAPAPAAPAPAAPGPAANPFDSFGGPAAAPAPTQQPPAPEPGASPFGAAPAPAPMQAQPAYGQPPAQQPTYGQENAVLQPAGQNGYAAPSPAATQQQQQFPMTAAPPAAPPAATPSFATPAPPPAPTPTADPYSQQAQYQYQDQPVPAPATADPFGQQQAPVAPAPADPWGAPAPAPVPTQQPPAADPWGAPASAQPPVADPYAAQQQALVPAAQQTNQWGIAGAPAPTPAAQPQQQAAYGAQQQALVPATQQTNQWAAPAPYGQYGAPAPAQAPAPADDYPFDPNNMAPAAPAPQPAPVQRSYSQDTSLQSYAGYGERSQDPNQDSGAIVPHAGNDVAPYGNGDAATNGAPSPHANKYSQELAQNAGLGVAPLPKADLVVKSGYVLSRISFRTILLKKWKQAYWCQYGPHTMLWFRSHSDFNDWLNNPYLTPAQRNFLIKLAVNFVHDLYKPNVRGYQVTQARTKPYGKQLIRQFKLERWMDYGPTIAAAFGSSDPKEIDDLRQAIVECMRNTPTGDGIRATGAVRQDNPQHPQIANAPHNPEPGDQYQAPLNDYQQGAAGAAYQQPGTGVPAGAQSVMSTGDLLDDQGNFDDLASVGPYGGAMSVPGNMAHPSSGGNLLDFTAPAPAPQPGLYTQQQPAPAPQPYAQPAQQAYGQPPAAYAQQPPQQPAQQAYGQQQQQPAAYAQQQQQPAYGQPQQQYYQAQNPY